MILTICLCDSERASRPFSGVLARLLYEYEYSYSYEYARSA